MNRASVTPRLKLFAAPAGQPRARRGTDVVLLVTALAGVLLTLVAYPPSGFEQALETFLAALPSWLESLWAFLFDLLLLAAVVLAVVVLVNRRFLVLAQAIAAVVLAAVLAIVAARLALGSWPELSDALLGGDGAPRFPNVRVAAATAVIVVLSPQFVRPVQVAVRWLLLLGVAGAVVIGGGTPGGNVAALLIAVVAAAAVRLALGTSAGRPSLADVELALRQLGVDARRLEEAERQIAGVFHVRGIDDAGRPLLVKVYGRDAYDTQLVARLTRRVWYRGEGPAVRLSRLHAAEHEAFVTLLARNGGIATHEVVTAGASIQDDALLVLAGEPRPFASLGADERDDELLRDVWRALVLLGGLGIAHQQIDPGKVVVSAGTAGLVDFGGAQAAASELQLATDRAQLLATTVCLAGVERSLRAAIDVVGTDGVASLLPYLQSASFGAPLRRATKAAGVDVDELREQAAAAAGVEPPELVKLRRVTPWSVAQIALLILASSAILTAAANIDWEEVGTAFSDASVGWIALALVVAQVPRLTQAVATLGSVPAALPLGPVYAMQLATGYMNLALPSYVGRMAMSIRFFQRQGLAAPAAVASGAIDSLMSTAVQAVLLSLLLLFSEATLALELPVPSGDSLRLVWILAGALAVTVLVFAGVPRLRREIAARVRRWWPDIRETIGALRGSNKLALLLFGNIATEVLFATALGLSVRAFGYDVTLAELLVINISVSLLASFIPVPGGIGVAEFGLVVGLTAAGLPAETALAATLLYRVVTFYLPPVWGFFALHWLQRNRYL